MRRKMPAVVIPLAATRRIARARTFQIGRVSCRSCALFKALIMEVMAPLAAQIAPKKPIANAAADVPPGESCSKPLMNVITPFGAIGSSSSFKSSKRWKRPSAPTRNAIVGKKASNALYAICWASPMQSSFLNAAKLRLNAACQSEKLSCSGELGARPAVAFRSVAVDNAEAAELCLRLALPPAPEDQANGCADASR